MLVERARSSACAALRGERRAAGTRSVRRRAAIERAQAVAVGDQRHDRLRAANRRSHAARATTPRASRRSSAARSRTARRSSVHDGRRPRRRARPSACARRRRDDLARASAASRAHRSTRLSISACAISRRSRVSARRTRSSARAVATSTDGSTGSARYASAPLSSPCTRAASSTCDCERCSTGIRAVAGSSFKPPADLEAVDVGQVDVEQDQVRDPRSARRRPSAPVSASQISNPARPRYRRAA